MWDATPHMNECGPRRRHKYHFSGVIRNAHITGACARDLIRVQCVPKWKESRYLRPTEDELTAVCARRGVGDACSLPKTAMFCEPQSMEMHRRIFIALTCRHSAGFSAIECLRVVTVKSFPSALVHMAHSQTKTRSCSIDRGSSSISRCSSSSSSQRTDIL